MADLYFGKGKGVIGASILGLLVPGGMLFEFLAAIQPLRFPRRLVAAEVVMLIAVWKNFRYGNGV